MTELRLDTDDDAARAVTDMTTEALLDRLVRDTWMDQRAPHWVVFEDRQAGHNYLARNHSANKA